MLASGFPRSILDCRAPVGSLRLAVKAVRALVRTLASLVGVTTGLVALAWCRGPRRTVRLLRRATCSLQPLYLWEGARSVYHLALLGCHHFPPWMGRRYG